MKILAVPRDRNPYQRLLYEEFTRRGHSVRYVGELTPSHSLNVLLLPAELTIMRLAGWSTLHVHWAFGFAFTGGDRGAAIRRASRLWFTLLLALTRALRLRVIWTAHNVLPHARVFDDDLTARRSLVHHCQLVVAHSHATLAELERLGMPPRRAVIAPHGPFHPAAGTPPLVPHDPPLRLLYFGQIQEYKGVEDLLSAMQRVSARVHLTVAGECRNSELAHHLRQLTDRAPDRVRLRLEWLAEPELERLLEQADVVVLPYRRVTTSGSALYALGHGRPLLVPDLPGLRELPSQAVLRYDGTPAGLERAIAALADIEPERLGELGRKGAEHVRGLGWEPMALAILEALEPGAR